MIYVLLYRRRNKSREPSGGGGGVGGGAGRKARDQFRAGSLFWKTPNELKSPPTSKSIALFYVIKAFYDSVPILKGGGVVACLLTYEVQYLEWTQGSRSW